MKVSDYQTAVERYRPDYVRFPEDSLVWATLALTGEAGEVAEVVKKVARDDGGVLSPEKRDALMLELGDVLWAITALANCLGITLEDVMQMNIDKLEDRYQRGVLHGVGSNR